jgi:hypothetical protein
MILCAMVKPLREDPIVCHYDELRCKPFRDRRLVKSLLECLSEFHMWVGHTIDYFDYQFLKPRANLLGVPFNLVRLTYDTMLAFKRIGYLTARNPKAGKPARQSGSCGRLLQQRAVEDEGGLPERALVHGLG